jgi:amino-acid N-acetyltransferase
MKIEKARISDVKQIHKLVNSHASKGEMLPRALSELYENIRDFVIIRQGDKVIACASLHIFWDDLGEVRATAVASDMHSKGLGSKLVKACVEEARSLGLGKVFCLTYQQGFFEKCGFHVVDKAELPQKVWGECMRCPKFPDCDEVALVYDLGGQGQ